MSLTSYPGLIALDKLLRPVFPCSASSVNWYQLAMLYLYKTFCVGQLTHVRHKSRLELGKPSQIKLTMHSCSSETNQTICKCNLHGIVHNFTDINMYQFTLYKLHYM